MQDHQGCGQIALAACTEASKAVWLLRSSVSKLYNEAQQQQGSICVLGADPGFPQGSSGAGPCRLRRLARAQGRMLSRQCSSCSDAQSRSLLHARRLLKPRACASTPACNSGSWSLSCWPGACFLPTSRCQLLLHAASHGPPHRVLAPAFPAGLSSPLGRQASPAGCPLSQHPWLCLAASLPLESSCWSLALPGASWAAALQSGFAR